LGQPVVFYDGSGDDFPRQQRDRAVHATGRSRYLEPDEPGHEVRGKAMANTEVAGGARIALAVLRLTFGTLGLLAPQVLIRRIEGPDADSPAAVYAFRLFGIRTILLGRALLVQQGPELRKSLNEAPLVHGSDTVTATLLTLGGHVPRRSGIGLIAVSAVNTALSLVARRASD
jgi:hypothetical protein